MHDSRVSLWKDGVDLFLQRWRGLGILSNGVIGVKQYSLGIIGLVSNVVNAEFDCIRTTSNLRVLIQNLCLNWTMALRFAHAVIAKLIHTESIIATANNVPQMIWVNAFERIKDGE